MSGRLYLHIGPPKTATTALQLALQNVQLDGFEYIGVLQPRTSYPANLAATIYTASRGMLSDSSSEVAPAVREVRKRVSSGLSVVLSEELFLLGNRQKSFGHKLASAAALLRDIPITVIVTLREPGEMLRSLYQERFDALPLSERMSFGAFCRSHAAECCDYVKVMGILREKGFDSVRLIRFEDIIRGSLSLGALLGTSQWRDKPLQVDVANTSRRSAVGNRREFPPVRVSLRRIPIAASLGLRIPVRPGGARHLEIPTSVDRRLRDGYSVAKALMEAQLADDIALSRPVERV